MKINLSLLIAIILIGTSLSLVKERKEAQAQAAPIVSFGGQISYIEMCCNGTLFATTGQYQSPAYGTFIMEWYKYAPNPLLGLGPYSWWSILPGEKVLGTALPGGICQTIASECEASTPVLWSVNQMGTTLIPSV